MSNKNVYRVSFLPLYTFFYLIKVLDNKINLFLSSVYFIIYTIFFGAFPQSTFPAHLNFGYKLKKGGVVYFLGRSPAA